MYIYYYIPLFIIYIFFCIAYSTLNSNEDKFILKYKKSQFNQDLSLYYNYFQNYKNGFFVEIGAHDGITLSNSYFFEKNFNWHGILIEGGENNCKKLISNSIYRTNSYIVCSPICKSGYINFNEHGFTGSIIRDSKNNKQYKCNTLKNITSFYNVNHIDLFSLDVEGSELEVLETFDFNVAVSHWMIEWNHLNKIAKSNITSLLNKNGYFIDKSFVSHIDILFSK